MFRFLGYRFWPRLADIGGTHFWRIDRRPDYSKLNVVSLHRLKLQRIAPHWDDMLRLGGRTKRRKPAANPWQALRRLADLFDHAPLCAWIEPEQNGAAG